MSDALAPATDEAPAPGLLARAVGVIFSPGATYAAVGRRPRVLGALAITIFVVSAGWAGFLSSEVGRQAVLDQQIQQAQSFGRPMTDAQYQAIERVAPYFGAFIAISQIIFVPLFALLFAGLSYALFTAILGGNATFKQALAVVAHAGFVIVVAQFFILPLDYIRESLTSPTSLAVFLPFLDENTFAARFLGAIDLVYLWWSLNLAIGLGVLYKRRVAPIASGLLALYAGLALIIAAVRTALSGA